MVDTSAGVIAQETRENTKKFVTAQDVEKAMIEKEKVG